MNASLYTLTELYDKNNIKKLANITHEDMKTIWYETKGDTNKGEDTDIKSQTTRIRFLCREALKNKYSNNIEYKYGKKTRYSGRLYAEGASLQNIIRGFRGLLSYSTAIDFDAINTHPVLLKELCSQHYIPCDELSQYVKLRDDKLREFCEIDDIKSKEAKIFFIKSFNSEYNITKKDKKSNIKNQFFLRYDAEMKKIQQRLAVIYSSEFKKIKKGESDNHYGKLVARLLNIEEGKMLNKAYEAVKDNYIPMTFAFDGLMLNKYDRAGKPVVEEDVIELLNKSTEELGIMWDVKEPDLSLQGFVDNLKGNDSVVLYDYTETELCKQIFNHFYKGKFYKRGAIHYLLINHKWTCCENTIKDHVIRTIMDCHGYVEKTGKDGDTSYQLITQMMTMSKTIASIILSLVPEDSNFINEAEKRSLHKISFKNGYWDFDLGRFKTYQENPKYDTINKIDRDFTYIPESHDTRKKLNNKIFYKMFCWDDNDVNNVDFKAMEHFLHQMGRAMCGIMTDKIWFNLQGERDSCKGVFDLILRNSFGEYVGTFNSSSFSLDNNSNADPELKQKFLLKNRYSRIATSNESAGCWLDGNLIKKVSSGGDIIDARNLFKNIESFQNVCKYMWLNNDASRIKPVDTLKTRWLYNMKCCFVDDVNKTQGLNGVTYYQKDDDVKQGFCNDPEVMNAFCSLLFDYYKRIDTSFPDELRENDEVNIDPISEAKRLFEFLTDGAGWDDSIPNDEIKQIYLDNKDSFDNLQHMKRIMKQLGAEDYKLGSSRGLRVVRRILGAMG
jgi:hypothetical protein